MSSNKERRSSASANFLTTPPNPAPGVLGDIVERNVGTVPTAMASGEQPASPLTSASRFSLRPVEVTVGRGFPKPDPAKHYGMLSTASAGGAGTVVKSSEKRVTFSAHVQPEESPGSPYPTATAGGPLAAPEARFQTLARQLEENSGAFPVGGSAGSRSAMARQWSSADFRGLYEGYYTAPLPPGVAEAHAPPREQGEGSGQLRGEEFFAAIFQCLRSTVRTHQGIALDALILHLQNSNSDNGWAGADLRERCLHGPDCAPFLFFIMNILGSAGHPFLCQQAAVCLLLLLGEVEGQDPLLAVLGEIGSPRADAPVDDTAAEAKDPKASVKEDHNAQKTDDDPDLPFSEISEMLRADGEMRAGIEKMGFTNHVMASMNTFLLPSPSQDGEEEEGSAAAVQRRDALLTLWLSLLCCGAIGESVAVSVRVAQDPQFLSRVVEPQISRFVLGEPASQRASTVSALDTPSMAQLLLVLYRLSHIPAALRHLLFGGSSSGDDTVTSRHHPHHYQPSPQEMWTLFIIALCTTKPAEVRSVEGVAAILLSFLFLREMARQGYVGLMHDTCDTLLSDGMSLGAGVVWEMWALLPSQSPSRGKADGPRKDDAESSVGHLLKDAARHALTQLSCEGVTQHEDADEEGNAARGALRSFAALANRHFLATYLATHRMESFTLLGSAVETQTAMQHVLANHILHSDSLATAFTRLSAATEASPRGEKEGGNIDCLLPLLSQVLQRPCSGGSGGGGRQGRKGGRSWTLAWQAALLLANVRLAAAIANAYPAVGTDGVSGYAAALAAKFQSACLHMQGNAQHRLQLDELCTMVEVLGILQNACPIHSPPSSALAGTAGSHEGGRGSSLPLPPPVPSSSYPHEARVAAVFLAHGIAITKQCLDAAPRAVACMLGLSPNAFAGAASPATGGESVEGTALALSLLAGVERTPIPEMASSPSVSAVGMPRSWVLHPLFDDDFPFKARWAQWLRQLLELHQGMKAVLGWDGLLSHTLLWVLAHRGQLFASAAAEVGVAADDDFAFHDVVAAQNGVALADLLLQLCGDLLMSPPSAECGAGNAYNGLSLHASRVLAVALSDYANPQSEEGLPRAMFYVLLLVATHCDPAASLAACQVVLLTPVLDDDAASSSLAAQRAGAEVASWTHRSWEGSSAPRLPTGFGLESVVALLQLTGPHLSRSRGLLPLVEHVCSAEELLTLPAHLFHLWCVCSVTFELLRRFVCEQQQQRQPPKSGGTSPSATLSTMQRTVLRGTLEELDWEPEPLWSLL